MKICIAGKNEIAIKGLELALEAVGHENVFVCPTKGDDGMSRWQPSLLRFAREKGVSSLELQDLYQCGDLVFLSLEFDRIVRPERFLTKALFNVHFSKLPAYKGMYTAAWPILNGEKCSGVTLHKIDAGIDTGEIIDQVEIEIGENETARDLYLSCMRASISLLTRSFLALLHGRYTTTPQTALGSSYYSKTSIDYSNLALDLRNVAVHVARQARALHFPEYQIPYVDRFPVGRAYIQDRRSRGPTGRVTEDGDDAIVVSTIDFDVRLTRDRSWAFFDFVDASDVPGILAFPVELGLINVPNASGWTPLMVAAYRGKVAVSRALINAGAELGKSNQDGTTPLMCAKEYGVRSRDFSICKLLMDSGADVDARDRFGRTVVDYARLKNESAALQFFGERSDA